MHRIPTPLLPCHWHWIASSTLELLEKGALAQAQLLAIFEKAPLPIKEGGYLLLLHRLEKGQYLERRPAAVVSATLSAKEREEFPAETRYFISEKGKNALKRVTLQRQLLQAFLQPYLSSDQP
ncbi:hypothetical protein A3SI_14019 [Nitritalea halalkaliphila LW7]|uniref:Uncharacterized protein n=1 Tax=Nitritalea halalkaliphila LW7 TaxID=1189621 RepID=I5C094_9BACT|nr:hypothetical protein [Nitritalea halalkaliphila]EIM75246.1 hypothetical protein A3SI_14019 [Nitritalea halalkaliphila LW7]